MKDKQTGQKVILSDKDMELIKRIQTGNVPDPDFNDYAVSKLTHHSYQLAEYFYNTVLFMYGLLDFMFFHDII